MNSEELLTAMEKRKEKRDKRKAAHRAVELARQTEGAIYAAFRAGWPRGARHRTVARAGLILFSIFLFPFSAFAQFTEVSGTITDPNGVPYAGAVVTANFIPSGGSPTLNGAQCCASLSAITHSNGAFSMTVPDNNVVQPGGSQWRFTVSLSPGVLPPLGTGPQSFSITVTITGATQSLTAALTAAAPALTQGSFGGGAAHQVNSLNLATASPVNFRTTSSATVANSSVGNVDITVIPDSTNQRVAVGLNGGATVSTRPRLNLIEGAGLDIAVADDGGNNEADVTASTVVAQNVQTGTSYTIQCPTDQARHVLFTNAAAVAVTLPQAGGMCFVSGFWFATSAYGAGGATITPTTSTINGGASLVIPQNGWALITTDGTDYRAAVVSPGGAPAFSAVTAGTNTAALLMGSGGSLGRSGTGIIDANQMDSLSFELTGAAAGHLICWDAGDTRYENCLSSIATNAQIGTTYTVLTGDRGTLVTHSNAAAIAVTLPQSGGAGFEAGWFYYTCSIGAGTATITPATSTINGAATLVLNQHDCATIVGDGTNYRALIQRSSGGGGGDSVQFNGTDVNTTINFTNRAGTGTIPGYTWTLTGGSPDTAQFAMDAATASVAGAVTNTTQTFGGGKTFTGNVTANIFSASSSGTNILTDIGPNSALSTTITVHGWDGSSPGGAGIFRGGDQSVGGSATFRAGNATSGAAGSASVLGGDTSATNAGGNLTIRPGASTNATPGNPGRLVFGGVANDGGTVTSGALQCMVSDRATADCAVNAANFLGIALSTGASMHIQEHGQNNAAMPLDVTSAGDCNGTSCTTVVGHFVCSSANVAGQVQPQTTACAAGRQVGIIFVAESAVTSLGIGALWIQFK